MQNYIIQMRGNLFLYFFYSPEWNVILFILRVRGRGGLGDGRSGAVPGLRVCLLVVLSALGLVGVRGANFGARTGPNDSGERDLRFSKEK